jgi:hypothetical protein
MEAVNGLKEEKPTRAHLIKKGDIITFKKPFVFKGEEYIQIGIIDIEVVKGSVRLIGFGRMTSWFKSYNALNDAIDWDWMDNWIIN